MKKIKYVSVSIGKKLMALFVFAVISLSSHAQLLWDLRGGVFYNPSSNADKETKKGMNYFGELGLDIPIGKKYAIETGVRYKNIQFMDDLSILGNDAGEDAYYYESSNDTRANLLEVPVKFGYKLPIWENTQARFSGGPYVSMGIENFGKVYQAGLALSATYEYKYGNLGINYNIPFYKGYKNAYPNGIYVTLGIKFHSRVWGYVGATLATICTVGMAAVSAFDNAADSGGSYSSPSGFSSYSNDDSSSSGSSSRGSSNNKCKYCEGSGTCSSTNYSARRKYCSGSGLCGYCHGSGWLDNHKSRCTACNGTRIDRETGKTIGDGKCSTCHGTGKCSHCSGTGYQ